MGRIRGQLDGERYIYHSRRSSRILTEVPRRIKQVEAPIPSKTPNIESTEHTMHESVPRPTYEKQNQELWATHDSKTPTVRINNNYSIKVEICLKRHIGEDRE